MPSENAQQTSDTMWHWVQSQERKVKLRNPEDALWCRFLEYEQSTTQLTVVWSVRGRGGHILGQVRWMPGRRKYALYVSASNPTIESRELYEIAGFVAEATRVHYALREAGKTD